MTNEEEIAGIADALRASKTIEELKSIAEMVIKPIINRFPEDLQKWLRQEYMSILQVFKDDNKPLTTDILELRKNYQKKVVEFIEKKGVKK